VSAHSRQEPKETVTEMKKALEALSMHRIGSVIRVAVPTVAMAMGLVVYASAESMPPPEPVSVPDGGITLLLLGSALAGVEVLRRRLRK
jgi:hypothetical protein